MTYFWIASYVFFGLALLTLLRIRMEPKDDTKEMLKALIKEFREFRLTMEDYISKSQPPLSLTNKKGDSSSKEGIE